VRAFANPLASCDSAASFIVGRRALAAAGGEASFTNTMSTSPDAATGGNSRCTRATLDQPAPIARATNTNENPPSAAAPDLPRPTRLPARSTYHGVRSETTVRSAPPPASEREVALSTHSLSAPVTSEMSAQRVQPRSGSRFALAWASVPE